MRYRRIVCFLLGAWVGIGAILAFNVLQNFSTVEQVLKAPPEQAGSVLKLLGPEKARMLLRYTAGMENANTYRTWELLQFAIGLLAAALLFLGSATRLFALVPVLMVLLVVFLHFWISPEMAWLDHLAVFESSTAGVQAQDHFWKLHGIYLTVEAVKDVLGFALAIILCFQQTRHRSRRSRPDDLKHVEFPHRGTAAG